MRHCANPKGLSSGQRLFIHLLPYYSFKILDGKQQKKFANRLRGENGHCPETFMSSKWEKQQGQAHSKKSKVGVCCKSERHMWDALKFRLEIQSLKERLC